MYWLRSYDVFIYRSDDELDGYENNDSKDTIYITSTAESMDLLSDFCNGFCQAIYKPSSFTVNVKLCMEMCCGNKAIYCLVVI